MKAAQLDVAERTTELLTRFNLSTVATELPRRLEDAGQREALGLLLEILEMEAEARQQRKIARLHRAAQLPPGKTFETLDHNVLPATLVRKLREIVGSDFLEHAHNALAFGLPGVGKSHAACAIGNALIEQGHSVLFRPAYRLVQELLAAKRDLMLPRALRRLDSFEKHSEAMKSQAGTTKTDQHAPARLPAVYTTRDPGRKTGEAAMSAPGNKRFKHFVALIFAPKVFAPPH